MVHFLLCKSSFITSVWIETVYQNKENTIHVLLTKPTFKDIQAKRTSRLLENVQ